MSVTFPKVRARVRSRLRDLDGKMNNPSTVEVDMAICDAFVAIGGDLPAPTLYTASAVTISAGTDFFTLPVTVASSGYGTLTEEYAGQVELQRVTDGRWLERKTVNELQGWLINPTTALGIPDLFALYQDNGLVVRGRCYPGAKVATVLNMYSSLKPNDLRDYVGTGGTEGLDTATVPWGRHGVAALVDYASAMLVARMNADALKLRGLNPNVADLWMREADRLIYQEAADRNALESNGQTQRRVP